MKKWSEVAASKEFQALAPDERESARRQYFDEVVAPKVPEQDRGMAWSEFSADAATTAPQKTGLGWVGERIGDAALNAGASVNRALEGFTNLAGADNGVSQFFRDNAGTLEGQVSEATKTQNLADQQELATTDGFGNKFLVGAKQAISSPLQSAGKALGFLAPTVVTGGAGAVAGMGARGLALLNAVTGAAQGAGAVKGGIYETVMQAKDADLMQDPAYAELRKTMPEAQAKEALATKQQSYAENPAGIGLGAAVGAATGATGAESALAKGLSKEVVRAQLAKDAALRSIPKVMLTEAATEVPQEMLETTLGNTGAASGGALIDPLQGVPEAGGQAAVMGPMAGGFGGGMQVQSARAKLRDLGAQPAVDANTVLDVETPTNPTLSLPAPVVRVDSAGNARMDGVEPPVMDEKQAPVGTSRDEVRSAVREELLALMPPREDSFVNARGEVEPARRVSPTPIVADASGQAVTDSQVEPNDVTVEPAARVVGRAPVEVRESLQQELAALGAPQGETFTNARGQTQAANRASPTPIRVDSRGTAALDGDTRSQFAAEEQDLEARAKKLFPKNEAAREDWKVAERSRALGYEAMLRERAAASNARKKARGVPVQVERSKPMRDVEATSELGVVRRTEDDGSTSYFFSHQPDVALVLKPSDKTNARAIVSIADDAQPALLRAALADGPLEAGRNTVARGVVQQIGDSSTDRFGVTRLIGRGADKAALHAETNRLAAKSANTLASRMFAGTPDMDLAVRAIAADPQRAVTALRKKDPALVLPALQELAGPDPSAKAKTPATQDALEPYRVTGEAAMGITAAEREAAARDNQTTATEMASYEADPQAVAREYGYQEDPDFAEYVTDAARDAVNAGHLAPTEFFAATRAAREGRREEAVNILSQADARRAAGQQVTENGESPNAADKPTASRSPGSRGGERSDGVLGRPWSGSTPYLRAAVRAAGAVTETGIHYSQQPRSVLNSGHFGSGLKGAERERLAGADPRLSHRIYFYIPMRDGRMPARESGVGAQAYRLTMVNLYEPGVSPPLEIKKGNFSSEQERVNAFELAVLDSGYDGYANRAAGQAVLLGQQSAPVDYVGLASESKDPMIAEAGKLPPAAPQPVKIGLMSKENAALEPRMAELEKVAPGAKLRFGTLTVDAEHESAARAFLKTLGDSNEQAINRSPGSPASGEGSAAAAGAGDGAGRGQGRGDADRQVQAPEQAVRGDVKGKWQVGSSTPLPGAPNVPGFHGPDPRLVAVAEQYARDNGITLRRQAEYVKVDVERASRIADAYGAMEHAPQDPAVKEAYENLIRQTLAQYKALESAGYKFWFVDLANESNLDYISTPWNAMRDIRANREMGVFPTDEGFGTSADFDPSSNPLLADTGIQWPSGSLDGPLKRVLANDLFRAVHDAFGHGLEGAGFRADGEENAWQAHVRLFKGSAVGAITSETRGQNSWLNYGPHGESNRTAKVEDTVFADQKTGLMPAWTWTEGRVADQQDGAKNEDQLKRSPRAPGAGGQAASAAIPNGEPASGGAGSQNPGDAREAAQEVSGDHGRRAGRLVAAGPYQVEVVGQATPDQLRPMHMLAAGSSGAFRQAIEDAKTASPNGAAVNVYSTEEYAAMKMFLSQDGRHGFAIKADGDIVSVFRHPDAQERGVAVKLVRLATAHGGWKLDAFDTVLPSLYGDAGFRAVARMAFNDEYSPDGWDYRAMAKYKGGRPDVVFMVFDPERAASGGRYQDGEGALVTDYDDATGAQQSWHDAGMKQPASPTQDSRSATVSLANEATGADRGQQDADIRALSDALSRDAGRPVNIRLEAPKSDSQLQLADTAQRVFGVRVAFFSSDDRFAPGGGAHLKDRPGVVYVNINDADPTWVAGHELLHALSVAHPDIYAVLLRAMRRMSKDSLANRDRQEGSYGTKVSDDLVEEENLADLSGFAFKDAGFWQALEAELSTPQRRKFWKWAGEWFAKLADKLKFDLSRDSEMKRAAAEMRDLFAKAYAEAIKRDRGVSSVKADLEFGQAAGKTKAAPTTQRANSVTKTPEFKRWFGASKIVDDNGEPQVMYHGTSQDFGAFRPGAGGAIFVTKNPVVASVFSQMSAQKAGDAGAPNIMPVYVHAENPFDFDNPQHVATVAAEIGKNGKRPAWAGTESEWAQWHAELLPLGEFAMIEGAEVQAAIKRAGFDAFYVKEGGTKNLAVYASNQLKSAIGNDGGFDPGNKDIRRSVGNKTNEIKTKDGKTLRHELSGDEFGMTLQVFDGDTLVGDLAFNTETDYRGNPVNPDVWVAEDYRRQGVASAMYDFALKQGAVMPPYRKNAAARTPEGEALRGALADRGIARSGGNVSTRSEAFKRWFGDSKVVDAKGDPLVVYHGTRSDFNAFEIGRKSVNSTAFGQHETIRAGIFFSPDKSFATGFAEQDDSSGRIIDAFLSIQEPFDMRAGVGFRLREAMRSDGINVQNLPEHPSSNTWKAFDEENGSRLVEFLKNRGYDGAIITEENEDGDAVDVYVAFSPAQIKSATGNNGDFDPNNPDIRRSGGSRPVADWDQPERTAAQRAVDTAVMAASKAGSPVTASAQAVNKTVDRIGQELARLIGAKKLGEKVVGKAEKAINAESSWDWVERGKQGLISDYGLPEEYLQQKVEKQARENRQLRDAKHLLDRMSTMGPDQLAVAYQWLQEKPDTQREQMLLAKLSPDQRAVMNEVKLDVDRLSREAVALGLISQETYDRNAMAYVHRSYKKHEAEMKGSEIASRQRAQRIKGNQFKGRGMELEASLDRVHGDLPENLKGLRLEMLEKRNADGRLIRRDYIPAGTPRPAALKDYASEGVWEVRDATRGGKLKVWRDFTLKERQKMGEIEDARYGFARTMLGGVRDVETARFLSWVGDEYAKSDATGLNLVELDPFKQMKGTQTYTRDEWVKVPDTKIKDTGVYRFGDLAGKYVPGVMWNDLLALGDFHDGVWDKLLSAWKISKTALSPAVHVNNVMSNFIMADLADVGVNDIRRALEVIVNSKRGNREAKALIERYQDSGAEAGSFAANELKSEVIEPLLKQIAESEPEAVQRASLAQVVSLAAHGHLGEAAAAATKTLPGRAIGGTVNAMLKAYQSEDAVFRLAKFLNEVNAGKSDTQAGKAARDAFLNYDINAPWVRAARRGPLPFISFTYRAVPLLAKAMATKPWKFAKYYALGQGLAMLAYGMLGDAGDEEKEKRLLPEDRRGLSILALPKMIRMPWNDKDGDPVWLDVRRWLPGADVAEVGNSRSAIPLPSWLSVGGPLSLLLDFYSNTNFNGQKIVQGTDSAGEMVEKVSDMMLKFMLPNLPMPGLGAALRTVGAPVDQGNLDPYAWASIERAMKGAKSVTGKTEGVGQTVVNTLGVKLDSRRLSEEVISVDRDFKAQEREIKTDITRVANQGARGQISREEMQRRIKAEIEKLQELGKKTGKKLTPQK